MTSLFKQLFGGKRQFIRTRQKLGGQASLHVEELESRTLMSTTSVLSTAVVPVNVKINTPANTFSDGNFAAPAQSSNSYSYNPTGSPWTFNGGSPNGSGVTTNGSGFTSGNPTAPTTQVAFLQEFGHISQSFTLSAGTYSISFLAAQRGNAQASFQALEVWLDNTLVDLVVPQSTGYTPYQTLNFTVTGTSTHIIQFKGVDPLQGNNTAFITNVQINPAAAKADPNEPGVLAQTLADFQRDGSITYNDMLGLFSTIEAQIAPVVSHTNGTSPPISISNTGSSTTSTVMSTGLPSTGTAPPTGETGYCTGGLSAAQLEWLQTIVADAASLHMAPDITYLANCVVNGNAANANYHFLNNLNTAVSVGLGNLFAVSSASTYGSMASQLQDLVNMWFLGENYPTAVQGTYAPAAGSLFNPATNVPSCNDVHQQAINDCWLMSTFAETALQMPGLIESMFTPVGTSGHVWAVRFYINGSAAYVTVDNQLPGNNGAIFGDAPSNGALWAALGEKAYAELFGNDSYQGINFGSFPQAPMSFITGRDVWNQTIVEFSNGTLYCGSASAVSINTLENGTVWNVSEYSENDMAAKLAGAFQTGQLVCVGSDDSPSSNIAANHEYAVIGVSQASASGSYVFTLGNPWSIVHGGIDGTNNLAYPGTVTLSEYQLFSNIDTLAFTDSPGPVTPNTSSGSTGGSETGAGSVPMATAPSITPFRVVADLFLSQSSLPQGNDPAVARHFLRGEPDPSSTDPHYLTDAEDKITVAHRDALFAKDDLVGWEDWWEQDQSLGQ